MLVTGKTLEDGDLNNSVDGKVDAGTLDVDDSHRALEAKVFEHADSSWEREATARAGAVVYANHPRTARDERWRQRGIPSGNLIIGVKYYDIFHSDI